MLKTNAFNAKQATMYSLRMGEFSLGLVPFGQSILDIPPTANTTNALMLHFDTKPNHLSPVERERPPLVYYIWQMSVGPIRVRARRKATSSEIDIWREMGRGCVDIWRTRDLAQKKGRKQAMTTIFLNEGPI